MKYNKQDGNGKPGDRVMSNQLLATSVRRAVNDEI